MKSAYMQWAVVLSMVVGSQVRRWPWQVITGEEGRMPWNTR
jgi:hypothetical protein